MREQNEDFVLADASHGIFLLADGMGGLPGGEVASRVAVETAHSFIVGRLADTPDDAIPRLLVEAFAAAHAAVFRRGLAEPALAGLGTTLDVVVLRGMIARWCHVGDSRIYLISNDRAERLTVDDNYTTLFARAGIAEADMPAWARHMLTQALGVSEELRPQVGERRVEEGEVLLLCSDGLTGVVRDEEIGRVVRELKDGLEEAADRLIKVANDAGGPDNISVILVDAQP